MHHGKSKGEGFYSLLLEFREEDKFINCSINFIGKLIVFLLALANIKMFNLQRKLMYFPKFLQKPPLI